MKFFEDIVIEFFVFVLLEPLKSADPPINSGSIFEIDSIASEEH